MDLYKDANNELDLGLSHEENAARFFAQGDTPMVDRTTAMPWFRMSLGEYFGFKYENVSAVKTFVELQREQIAIITPLGWMDSSSYLESVAMAMSEVWEAYSESDPTQREIEIIDVILRVIVLCERIRLECGDDMLELKSVLCMDTVIDNRFSDLNTKQPSTNAWYLAMYNKMASMVNMLRGKTFDKGYVHDLVSCCNQVLYLCFLLLDQINQVDRQLRGLEESDDYDLINFVIGLIKYKIERNRIELPRKRRYK